MFNLDRLLEAVGFETRIEICDPLDILEVLVQRGSYLRGDSRAGKMRLARDLAGNNSQAGAGTEEVYAVST